MIDMAGYIWARPYWLVLIPLAVIMAAALARRTGRLGAWERAVDPALMAAMRRMGRVIPGQRTRTWLPACVLAALGLALAGPHQERRENTSYRNLDAVVLVLDLSPSVTEGERLFDVLTTARLLVQAGGTRQNAVILYAGEAYTAVPFSTDPSAVQSLLSLIDGQTMPVAGSRPAAGLRTAATMLAEAQMLTGEVVLITDGGGVTPTTMDAVTQLTASGYTVSAVLVPGDTVGAGRLDALVLSGGGTLGTLADPFSVADRIAARPVDRLAETGYALLLLQDLGRYLLILALIPAFFLLPRRARP